MIYDIAPWITKANRHDWKNCELTAYVKLELPTDELSIKIPDYWGHGGRHTDGLKDKTIIYRAGMRIEPFETNTEPEPFEGCK